MNMKQYETFELRFGGEVLPDAWAQIDLTATFSCAQESLTVKGFYDGESDGRGVYVVRFLPQYAGVYRYQVRGAVTVEGEIVCEASSPEAHGIVRAVGTHFAFADGAPYIPFGTTVYALISQDDALVEQTLQSLAAAPFNKLRLCVFPKDYDYNHNEPPLYAFARREEGSWDTSRPSIAFYQRLERILRRIAALGIQLDLILFHPYDRWGFAAMPQADNFRYLDYLLRRLSAMPEIWWSLANEYDLCMPKKTLADWEALEAFVASCDAYHHLLSCHNCFCFWDFKRKDVTHASIQTRALTEIPRYLREYGKPVVIDECCYEGDLPQHIRSGDGSALLALLCRRRRLHARRNLFVAGRRAVVGTRRRPERRKPEAHRVSAPRHRGASGLPVASGKRMGGGRAAGRSAASRLDSPLPCQPVANGSARPAHAALRGASLGGALRGGRLSVVLRSANRSGANHQAAAGA